ncbi:hypothetical protein [Hymenobacter persicinus]|uniref:Uncharacterized protein n=1 Tax=Hymenobacter persicinus TaxID=2025506 RepID=A0A4Q5LG68_9BACT|nr:hypothetical protein [Hymenobacter persicinus]RYU84749.1 hypothetical protein EWM57_00020 [Hymenobacter persicinus]
MENQNTWATLLELLHQVDRDLADPSVYYLLGGHYYDRDNHPRRRHYPAVFSLHHGEVANLEIGPDFVAFDTEFVRHPEDDEPHVPVPWIDRFRATIPFEQLYQLLRKVIPPGEEVDEQLSFLPTESVYYNERIHRENYPTPWTINQP